MLVVGWIWCFGGLAACRFGCVFELFGLVCDGVRRLVWVFRVVFGLSLFGFGRWLVGSGFVLMAVMLHFGLFGLLVMPFVWVCVVMCLPWQVSLILDEMGLVVMVACACVFLVGWCVTDLCCVSG